MSIRESAALAPEAARQLSPLRLAYMGDTVWELLVRSRQFDLGLNVHHMHQMAVAGVNAAAQARALTRMQPLLTEDEHAVAQRGRNAHARHHAPKNQNAADYAAATALETLVGYLYLTGQEERLMCLFRASQEEVEPCPKAD